MAKNKSVRQIGVGLIGLGTVGTGVYKILVSQVKAIEQKTGVRLVLKKVCVKSPGKKRPMRVPKRLLTTNPAELINDPSIDILVELIGGIHPAKEILAKAFLKGKHVVTANKALLAEEGDFIFGEAFRHGRMLGIEASVCGGIPIIKSIAQGLASNEVSHFLGIVNGTCNYILTAMSRDSLEFGKALSDAQSKGYAEKNPGLDIDGIDSAHKLAILARLAFRLNVPFRSISVEGIRSLSVSDIEYAKELGYIIKLLAVGKKMKNGIMLRVHPVMLPLDHPLANVRGVYNAVFLHADQAGDLLFYGRGAGMYPTASAVMSDVIDIAKKISAGDATLDLSLAAPDNSVKLLPLENIVSKYYLRFQVADKPGVLGMIAQTLGRHGISILSVHQKESHDTQSVPVIILTYEASEKSLKAALKAINAQNYVTEKTVVLRVEK